MPQRSARPREEPFGFPRVIYGRLRTNDGSTYGVLSNYKEQNYDQEVPSYSVLVVAVHGDIRRSQCRLQVSTPVQRILDVLAQQGLCHGANVATSSGSAARQQGPIARQDFKVLHLSRRAEVWLVGMPIKASRRATFGARTAKASFAPRADAAKQQRSPIPDHGAVRETGDRPSVSFEIIAVARIDESKRKRPCGTGCA